MPLATFMSGRKLEWYKASGSKYSTITFNGDGTFKSTSGNTGVWSVVDANTILYNWVKGNLQINFRFNADRTRAEEVLSNWGNVGRVLIPVGANDNGNALLETLQTVF